MHLEHQNCIHVAKPEIPQLTKSMTAKQQKSTAKKFATTKTDKKDSKTKNRTPNQKTSRYK